MQIIENIEQLSDIEENSDWKKNQIQLQKFGYCEVCLTQISKYRCPKCKLQSCSLNCVNRHKITKQCDGIYTINKYIKKSQYNEKVFRKDLNFLSNQLVNTERIKKRLSVLKNKNSESNFRLKQMKQNLSKIHNIQFVILPQILSRNRENISFFYNKEKSFYWVTEFILYNQLDKPFRILSKPMNENKSILEIIQDTDFYSQDYLINHSWDLSKLYEQIQNEEVQIFIENSYQTDFMIQSGYETLLPIDHYQASLKVVIVQQQQKLINLLKFMKITEFPKFYIVKSDQLEYFRYQYPFF